MSVYEFLECKKNECYFRLVYSKFLHDLNMIKFYYNAMNGFNKKIKSLTIEQALETI